MHARRLPARHGLLWLLASFRVFRMNPPLLSALTMAYLFLIIMVNALPRIGPFLVPLALPTMILIIANGCRAIEGNRSVSAIVLTQGIKSHSTALVGLGGLHLLGAIILLFVSTAIEGGNVALPSGAVIDEKQMAWIMVRLFIIALPAIAAFWFAPLLVGWDSVAPVKSIFFSLVAALRNWRAFFVYGAVIAVFGVAMPWLLLVVASLISQTLLGILSVALKMAIIFILAPTMMAGIYISYRDVFHGTDEAA